MQLFSAGVSAVVDRLDRVLRKSAIAAVAGTGLMLGASQTHAVVVYSGVVNLSIPSTTNGIYLNVVTGANNLPGSTAGTTVPGWDINLYSSNGLGFFNPTAPAGGAYVISSGTTVANLAAGTLIGSGNLYSSGGTTLISQWNLNSSDNLFGFRFINEADGLLHYGWARLALSSPITSTRSIVEYGYESTALTGITAGAVTAVPEPAAHALMGLGVAGLLLARSRNKA